MRVPFGSFAVCVPAVALSAFFLTSAALLSLCAVSDSFCPAQEVTAEARSAFPSQTTEAAAETARWMVASANWGVLETSADGILSSEVVSFSDGVGSNLTGRVFTYVMCGEGGACTDAYDASLTLSQAALNLSKDAGAMNSCEAQKSDPEDPRCAKLTLAGKMTKATGDAEVFGKQALFARHPQMKHWPASHGFAVYELVVSDVWMIDFYGGGATIPPSTYYAAKPRRNVPHWPPAADEEVLTGASAPERVKPPPYSEYAKRARWLVYESTWTVVGTTSVRLAGQPWGNVRSTADLVNPKCPHPDPRCCTTGRPVVYVPDPDPTAVDLSKDSRATLTFTEAALPARLSAEGTCGGMDSEDPTCARLTLSGRLRPLAEAELDLAKLSLGARHPLAPWLAAKGAHTGGKWYTLDIESLVFLDFYGAPAKLTVKEYLSALPQAGECSKDDDDDESDSKETFKTILA